MQRNGDKPITTTEKRKEKEVPKRDFTIQRRGQNQYERTVVGKDGRTHVMQSDREGRNGHFTDEGRYRRAIGQVVAQNRRA